MPELSIIVPVYKVEPYLRKCIDSILAQTFTDFELILVDDGSPDQCPQICDDYASKDDRIIVIHQPNKGVSAARNAGLDKAKGKYIGFVDSDDWIEPDMYEEMIHSIVSTNSDVVICAAKYENEDQSVQRIDLSQSTSYSCDELLLELFGMPTKIGGACWNKLIRFDTVKNVRFDSNIAIAEDWIYLFNCFIEVKAGAHHLPSAFYHVVERLGSATRTNNVSVYSQMISSKYLLLKMLQQERPQYIGYGIDKFLDDCERYIPIIRESGRKNHIPYRMKIIGIKSKMIYWIFYGFIHRSLNASNLRGHTLALLKI